MVGVVFVPKPGIVWTSATSSSRFAAITAAWISVNRLCWWSRRLSLNRNGAWSDGKRAAKRLAADSGWRSTVCNSSAFEPA